MRFTRLKLTNWRNFRSADVPLCPRTFVVGPNASGKSNLLDAIRFLKELAEPGGGLQRAVVEQRGGLKAIRSIHARNVTYVGIEAAVTGDDGVEWVYELRIAEGDRKARLPHVVKETVERRAGLPSMTRVRNVRNEDPDERTQTWLEQRLQSKDFRELAKFFASVEYSHVVPQVVREQRRPADQSRPRDPYGSDLIEDMATTPIREQKRRLGHINQALQGVLPQLVKIGVGRDKVGRPYLDARYQHWRKPSARQDESQFSDGTLRLLGLLWTLSGKGGPVLLEEPEISLHEKAVALLPALLHRVVAASGRQIIVSTHSLSLVNDAGIEPREVVALESTREDTKVHIGTEYPMLVDIARQGQPFGHEIVGMTAPPEVDQLDLFLAE
ncbi:MAG TPA: AAA family ATPase [Kofleriaceae bacterium]|nr:AAA family ATPase [Kofleriaceae bacterium]